jgi:hypothetical protein
MQTYQVRLKPYNRATGHVRLAVSFVALGNMSFQHGVVVDGITEREAEVLRKVRQRNEDPECKTPLAFDILPAAEMKKLLSKEAKAKLGLTPDIVKAIRELNSSGELEALNEGVKDQPEAGVVPAAYLRSRAAGEQQDPQLRPAPPQPPVVRKSRRAPA